MPTLRRADPDDARALASLAERTFRDTFASSNTADDMDLHCRNTYGESIQRRELEEPARVTLVCEDGGRLIGYAQVRFGIAPDCVSATSPGEILRLYVTADWHGRGVARDLMDAALDEIAARGSDVAWLGVWEHNPRAMAFYEKYDFVAVGEHVFPVGTDPQRDIVMMRRAAPRPRC